MNNFTGIVKVSRKFEMRYTGDNQTPIANSHLNLMVRYGSGDTFTIQSVAWGKMAERVYAMDEGTIALVTGQLNMMRVDRDGVKDTIASLKISEIITELPELKPFNQLTILGNVGQEVDAKWFESGKNNAKFSLAVRRTKDDTDWFAIETWGDTAKVVDQYVSKGSKVGITGHLKIESWTDKTTGEVRTKPVIIGDRIELAGKNGGGDIDRTEQRTEHKTEQRTYQKAPESAPATSTRSSTSARSNAATEPDFDDIPF